LEPQLPVRRMFTRMNMDQLHLAPVHPRQSARIRGKKSM